MIGRWVKAEQPVQFQKGNNDLVLLSQAVGLQVKCLVCFLPIFEFLLLLMVE